MARITLLFFITLTMGLTHVARAQQPRVVTALVHSDETFVVGKSKKNVQQYGSGDMIYLILDVKKPPKGKYRVTLDPTNLKGFGWIDKSSVRILSNYHSSDGKNPKEYQKKYVKQDSQLATASDADLFGGDNTFIDDLVTQEQTSLNNDFGDIPDSQTAVVPLDVAEESNEFEEDLDFLFTDDPEFNDVFMSEKNEVAGLGPKNVGISSFTSAKGKSKEYKKVAEQVRSKFERMLLQKKKLGRIDALSNLSVDISTPAHKSGLAKDVTDVFYGVLIPEKLGKNYILKIKYFDTSINSFVEFGADYTIPVSNHDSKIDEIATRAAQFLK